VGISTVAYGADAVGAVNIMPSGARLFWAWLLLVLIAVVPGAVFSGEAEMYEWSATSGSLPRAEDGWLLFNGYGSPDPQLDDGLLRINSLACRDINDRVGFEDYSGRVFPKHFVLEARVRILAILRAPRTQQSGVDLGVCPCVGKYCVIEISPGSALVNGQTISITDTHNGTDFHTYRFETNRERYVLLVDGVKRASGALASDPDFWTPYVWWGDFDRLASATSEWMYVRHNARRN
jgi:hypothetical protein